MNLAEFFEHWSITENPFRGEEARHDAVFARMSGPGDAGQPPLASSLPPRKPGASHSDFEKILGDLARPSTSIVFGEKGSGKTAIRLQIEERVRDHNAAHAGKRVLLVPHDDLNSVLDRFHARSKEDSPDKSLTKFRLVDHIDAILGLVVPRLIDGTLDEPTDGWKISLGPEPRRTLRHMDPTVKRDLLMLQAVYDRASQGDLRTKRLRKAMRLMPPKGAMFDAVAVAIGWIPGLGVIIASQFMKGLPPWGVTALLVAGLVLLGLWLAVLGKHFLWDRLQLQRIGIRLERELKVLSRPAESYARSLRQLDPILLTPTQLPTTSSDEQRYAMIERLHRVLARVGFTGLLVVLDRIDEPTLISGDAARMRSVVWPMLNNKFLQQSGIGFKLLLPIELRHALLKESSAFFQEARLDKQNMVERLSWTGSMLYDLCDARLQACRKPEAPPISLIDLFAEDVTPQDLVDALDQMHQPRDAFKFLYACLSEHCSNVTRQSGQWRVPRLVLETVRKQQSERVQALYRGISPA